MLVTIAVPGFCGVANAQNEAPSRGANRTLTFLDPRPVKVDFDKLKQRKGVLSVDLRNNARHRAQVVTVRVVGLESPSAPRDRGLRAIEKSSTVKKRLRRLASRSFALKLDTSIRPKRPGSHSGVLVATGSLGAVRRRDFTLVVRKQPRPGPAKHEEAVPALQPKTLTDFSVGGTNYLPSIISPLPPALFGLGVLLLIGAALLSGPPGSTPRGRRRAELRDAFLLLALVSFGAWGVLAFGHRGDLSDTLGVVLLVVGVFIALTAYGFRRPEGGGSVTLWGIRSGLALVGIGLVFAASVMLIDGAGYTDAPSPREIKVQAPRVAKGTPPGTVGALVAGDGTVAVTEIEGVRLDVDGLERADEYVGNIDLLPDKDKQGEAKLTANVRDFWGYPLLVIALGVLIGYLVTRYFTQTRPLQQQELRIDPIRTLIDDRQSDFAKSHGRRPHRDLAMSRRASERLHRAEAKLDDGDADGAKKILDDLASYSDKFELLRRSLTRLDERASEFEELVSASGLGLDPKDVLALTEASRLLAEPFDSDDVDQDSALLEARAKDVDELNDLLESMIAMLIVISSESKTIPDDQMEGFRKDALGILTAASLDKAREAWAAAQQKYLASLGPGWGRMAREMRLAMRRQEAAPPEPEPRAIAEQVPVKPRVKMPQRLRPHITPDQFRERDRQMTYATGFLAVGSGLLALYFASDTWGSPDDYLKALFWGSVLSEGVKYIASTVSRAWPVK